MLAWILCNADLAFKTPFCTPRQWDSLSRLGIILHTMPYSIKPHMYFLVQALTRCSAIRKLIRVRGDGRSRLDDFPSSDLQPFWVPSS